jgi:hypothetical protein
MSTTYSFENLAAGAIALRDTAIKVACYESSMPPGEADRSYAQKQDAGKIAEYFAFIPALFAPFGEMPRPEAFESAKSSLRAAASPLQLEETSTGSAPGQIQPADQKFAALPSVTRNLASWKGTAAQEFTANYLDRLPYQVGAQHMVLNASWALFAQEQQVWQDTQKAVVDNLNGAIDTLNDLMSHCSGGSSWAITFTVVASLAAIIDPILALPAVAAFETAEGTALALAAIDSGASVTGAIPVGGGGDSTSKQEQHFSGKDAFAVIDSVQVALQKICQNTVDNEAKVAQAFQAIDDAVNEKRGMFVGKRPLLAGATSKNVAGDDYMGLDLG